MISSALFFLTPAFGLLWPDPGLNTSQHSGTDICHPLSFLIPKSSGNGQLVYEFLILFQACIVASDAQPIHYNLSCTHHRLSYKTGSDGYFRALVIASFPA